MFDDKDIKIAGDKPSVSVARHLRSDCASDEPAPEHEKLEPARSLGSELAAAACNIQHEFSSPDDDDCLIQRRLLMSFAVSTGLDRLCSGSVVSRTALNVFYNTLKKTDVGFYDDLSNTGAFSFYYLAIRRSGDPVRRIGQTYAMLCSRDGDPVCQELGETLYCDYTEMVRSLIEKHGLLKED